MSLNPAQRAAVRNLTDPLLVIAGAGSGKTRVIAEKIVHLLHTGVAAAGIYAITFTNKAAREMRERVARRVSAEAAAALTICTFHALGLKLLQIEHQAAGLRRGFTVLDADDAFNLFKDLAPKGASNDALRLLRSLIGAAKDQGLSPEQALAAARSAREREAAELYAVYQRRLRAFNAVDFDDLLALPARLLGDDAALRLRWQQRIQYLLVDEYQDTSRSQYQMLRLLVAPGRGFTAVGDDDQSIYSWRGANPENLNELARDFPGLNVVKLEQNYRCSGRILAAANALIANNPHLFEKKLWSALPEGAPIRILDCRDEAHEAERVAAEIAHRQEASKAPWHEFAVLYRGNHQARAFEQALRVLRVPYHVSGGTAFFERTEIRDLLAYLRLLVNPDDDAAFLRAVQAPRREIGSTTLEKLAGLAAQQSLSLLTAATRSDVQKQLAARPGAALLRFGELFERWRSLAARVGIDELLAQLIADSGYLGHIEATVKDPGARDYRRENLKELGKWLGASLRGRDALSELSAQLALLSFSERDEPGNAVRLSTLHAAKGLEFDHVWLVGVEDGTLPHEESLNEGRLDEERRLMYVAITRARHNLTISHARQRQRFGNHQSQDPSRFIAELPPAVVSREGDDPEREAAERRERASSQLARIAALFKS
ncbi:MAG: UvrD-helicase domain-containing protein [Lysobacterales bacterium]